MGTLVGISVYIVPGKTNKKYILTKRASMSVCLNNSSRIQEELRGD
jgi:hypothetical protein